MEESKSTNAESAGPEVKRTVVATLQKVPKQSATLNTVFWANLVLTDKETKQNLGERLLHNFDELANLLTEVAAVPRKNLESALAGYDGRSEASMPISVDQRQIQKLLGIDAESATA